MSNEKRQQQLTRLVDRVIAGKVVFFIGAGFSLDSEGNSGKLLILRLLVRFEALCSALAAIDNPDFERAAETAKKLHSTLRTIFNLKTENLAVTADANTLDSLFSKDLPKYLDILAQNYFQINDWMCGAFEELLGCLPEKLPENFLALVVQHEQTLLKLTEQPDINEKLPGTAADRRPGELDLLMLKELSVYCEKTAGIGTERTVAGKALFLDAMGFAEDRVMKGAPMAHSIAEAVAASAGRLRVRHHVLAWLAAEGLCPVLVTTNFDLLLESAYRLSGLLPLNPPALTGQNPEHAVMDSGPLNTPLNQRYGYFARITYAAQFFSYGEARQAVQLFKIHGCVDAYRIAREAAKTLPREAGFKLLRTVLPTMVFTFREIQNWREDTWSRDYLNTLLRTRTLVFSGYSGADPVIHDTFRTIYEEMAGYQSARVGKAAPSLQKDPDGAGEGEAAPAFLLAPSDEFHGLEILRAASMASGTRRPKLADHPNFISFHIGDAPTFPNLDEVYVWFYHLLARKLQQQSLANQLHHSYYQLTGQRCPNSDVNAIIDNFKQLIEAEERLFIDFEPNTPHRIQFQNITGWTWYFHRALLREYALAENFLRRPVDGLAMQSLADLPWYCPISEHPGWAAWGVILEIALRRAYGALCKCEAETWKKNSLVIPVQHNFPTLALSRPGKAKRALSIEISSFRDMFKRRMPRFLQAEASLCWEIRNETVPWWREGSEPKPDAKPNGRQSLTNHTPSAKTLWEWAALPEANWKNRPEKYFGLEESANVKLTA